MNEEQDVQREPGDDTEGNYFAFSDQNVKDNVKPVDWSAESEETEDAEDTEGHSFHAG